MAESGRSPPPFGNNSYTRCSRIRWLRHEAALLSQARINHENVEIYIESRTLVWVKSLPNMLRGRALTIGHCLTFPSNGSVFATSPQRENHWHSSVLSIRGSWLIWSHIHHRVGCRPGLVHSEIVIALEGKTQLMEPALSQHSGLDAARLVEARGGCKEGGPRGGVGPGQRKTGWFSIWRRLPAYAA